MTKPPLCSTVIVEERVVKKLAIGSIDGRFEKKALDEPSDSGTYVPKKASTKDIM